MAANDIDLSSFNRAFPVPPDEAAALEIDRKVLTRAHELRMYILMAALVVVVISMGIGMWRLATIQANLRPIVIRINEAGIPSAVRYEDMQYRPQEAELRYFLQQFIVDVYSRQRQTAQYAFQRRLAFLARPLAQAELEHAKSTGYPESFISSADDEIEIVINNVSVADLRAAPYRAIADFEKVFRQASDRREIRREKWLANFQVSVIEPAQMQGMANREMFLKVNPLGLVVTYYRADAAF